MPLVASTALQRLADDSDSDGFNTSLTIWNTEMNAINKETEKDEKISPTDCSSAHVGHAGRRT